MTSEEKVWPYGTVVIDEDREVIMLLGFSPDDGYHNAGIRLVWPGVWDGMVELREIVTSLINDRQRYWVQE